MHRPTHLSSFLLAVTALATAARGQDFLFATSQDERTLSGSGGTSLQFLHRNEVARVQFVSCAAQAEKWGARTAYQTMAGDENGDGMYWNPGLFGKIDALVHLYLPGQVPSPQSVFWSPTSQMGTNVSGGAGLRPGDVGRIVAGGGQYGQVQYFLSAEQVQLVLGLPTSPIVVDVDGIAADPAYGIFFTLEQDIAINTTCSSALARDGDLLMIPPNAITWTQDMRVASVVPGSALVVYPEALMDQMVQNAQVADANGNCVQAISDLKDLDIDFAGRQVLMTFCSGTYWIPTFFFTGELMTGGSILSTANFGTIAQRGCALLGTPCGQGATLGDQMGLLPPAPGQGVPSYISALDTPFFTETFLIEPQQHVVTSPAPIALDVNTPAAFTLIAVEIVGPLVAPHVLLPPPPFFPDLYVLGSPPWQYLWFNPGIVTITTPPAPFPLKVVFQAGTIVNGNVMLSAPASVDVL